MIKPEWRFVITCDTCGGYLQENDAIVSETQIEAIIDDAEWEGWKRINGKWLCPDCQVD